MENFTIQLPEEEAVVLSAASVRRLVSAGNGDAALLYLALLENRGKLDPKQLTAALHWSPDRLTKAEYVLLSEGLVSSRQAAVFQEPPDQRPEYSREDVARQLEGDPRFAQLTANVEGLLGKKLSTPDLDILLGLYDYLGLPCEVIFLLVNHCIDRLAARYGPGRRPTLRQIEREGYAWARMGLLDLDSANRYLMKYAGRRSLVGQYMSVLRLGDRLPSPSEERNLLSFAEMEFPPEAVELAYDKTMLKCKELRWSYMSKILRNWHEKGLHTLEEIQEGDRPPAPRRPKEEKAGSNVARMKKYLEHARKQEG